MGALSIRGVSDQLSTLLKQQAEASHKSVNQFVLETLKQHVGLGKSKRFTRRYDDLDDLFGKWSENQYKQVQRKIDGERKIDEELWK